MDGLLIVDKPSGPTSHDIVARVRRALRERRIGHTGTLDPMASGVLPLVIGRATRLARFLSGDKTYEATIRLGQNTDTYDAEGRPSGPVFDGPWPSRDEVDAVLGRYRGTFMQQPPAYSAKKIAGTRSYALARQTRAASGNRPTAEDATVAQPALPEAVSVTTHAIDLLDQSGNLVRLRVRCSAGFYIRSLAFDLGAALGTGAHLVELRRTEAAGFGLEDAMPLDRIEGEGGAQAATDFMVPIERMLPALPAVSLTDAGVAQVRFGRNLGPADASAGFEEAVRAATGTTPAPVRVLGPSGHLVAIAEPAGTPGLLHPGIVLL